MQRTGPLHPLDRPRLGEGPQLSHLKQNLQLFLTWNSVPIVSLATFLAYLVPVSGFSSVLMALAHPSAGGLDTLHIITFSQPDL